MMQGRSYLAGLVTGVIVAGVVGVIGMSVTAARAATQAQAAKPATMATPAQAAKPATKATPAQAAKPATKAKPASAAAAATPATMAKPAVKVLLENAQVRVREVTFAPGTGDTHTHPYAHVGVILTKGALAFQSPGEKEEVTNFEAGSVGFREAKVTHQVRNPGKAPMKVIEVELK